MSTSGAIAESERFTAQDKEGRQEGTEEEKGSLHPKELPVNMALLELTSHLLVL
jgi:hypothetical protein